MGDLSLLTDQIYLADYTSSRRFLDASTYTGHHCKRARHNDCTSIPGGRPSGSGVLRDNSSRGVGAAYNRNYCGVVPANVTDGDDGDSVGVQTGEPR